jgi:holo-[acyl-carrier protein] synthase
MIEISRIAKAYKRWGDSLLHRVYTDEEIIYCLAKRDPSPCLAARFAAKEAAYKALAQAGLSVRSWRELSVKRGTDGRPQLWYAGQAGLRLHLSLTHSHQLAGAVVVVEKNEEKPA